MACRGPHTCREQSDRGCIGVGEYRAEPPGVASGVRAFRRQDPLEHVAERFPRLERATPVDDDQHRLCRVKQKPKRGIAIVRRVEPDIDPPRPKPKGVCEFATQLVVGSQLSLLVAYFHAQRDAFETDLLHTALQRRDDLNQRGSRALLPTTTTRRRSGWLKLHLGVEP